MAKTLAQTEGVPNPPSARVASQDELIERYVEECTDGGGRHRSWVVAADGHWVPIWVLARYLRYGGTTEAAATAYGLSAAEMAAALAYYERYREVLDAWLTLNHDANEPGP